MNRVPRYAQRATRPHRLHSLYTQPQLSSFSVCLHRRPKYHYSNAPPHGHTCHGVTPGHVCHAHTVYYPAPCIAHVSFVFSLSLFATGFPVTPHEPGPVPLPASGFRPSGLPTPVSTGVPTGARNLGVRVILFRASFRNHPLVLSFVNPPHPLLPPPNFPFLILLMYPRVSLFHSSRPDFRLHPTSPAPRLHRPPASGRRVSAHLFPRAYLRVPVI